MIFYAIIPIMDDESYYMKDGFIRNKMSSFTRYPYLLTDFVSYDIYHNHGSHFSTEDWKNPFIISLSKKKLDFMTIAKKRKSYTAVLDIPEKEVDILEMMECHHDMLMEKVFSGGIAEAGRLHIDKDTIVNTLGVSAYMVHGKRQHCHNILKRLSKSIRPVTKYDNSRLYIIDKIDPKWIIV